MALLLNGTSDYVQVADDSRLSPATTGAMTWSIWLRPDTLTFPMCDGSSGDRYVNFLSKVDNDTGGHKEFAMRMYSADNTVGRANRISLYLFDGVNGGANSGTFVQEPVSVGVWIHIMVTWDGATLSIYKNNVFKNSNPIPFSPVDTTAPFRIGTGQQVNYGTPSYFLGALADVRIWNRVLTSTEMTTVHSGGAVTSGLVANYTLNETSGTTATDSVNGLNGVENGGIHVTDSPFITPTPPGEPHYLLFDGASSYVEIPDKDAYSLTTTGELTVSCDIKPYTDQFTHFEDTGYVNFLSKFTYDTTNTAEWEFRIYNKVNNEGDGRDNELSFYVFSPSGGLGVSGDAPKCPLNTNRWITLVGTLKLSTQEVAMYRNGEHTETDYFTSVSPTIAPANTTSPIRIGRGADDTSFFYGLIRNVRIYNRVLPQSDINKLVAKTPVTNGLVGEWLLNDLNCTDTFGNNGTNHGCNGVVDYTPRNSPLI